MTKINLSPISNLQNESTVTSTINVNNAIITAAIDNSISRDGTQPNNMNSRLDMNSNAIINLPDATTDQEPVTYGQYLSGITAVEGGAVIDGPFILAESSGDFSNERVLTAGNNISVIDGGAGGNFEVSVANAQLNALALALSDTDKLPYYTAPNTADVTDLTAFARTILDDADAASVRTTIGAGAGDMVSSTYDPTGQATDAFAFLQAGTGAVSRTVQEKAQDFVSVKDYGATGDGTTDDYAAIVAADAAAATLKCALYIPAGNYRISGTLTPSANAHWIGASSGETSFYMVSTTATLFVVSNTNVELSHFRCLPVTTRTETAKTFDISGTNFYVHDVKTYSNGVSFALSTSDVNGILERVQTTNTVVNGIDLDVSDSFFVSLIDSVFSGDPAARAYAHVVLRNVSGQIQLLNCGMFQANQGIVVIPGTGQVVTLVKCDTTYVDSCNTYALSFVPSGDGIIQRFSFVNGWLNSSTALLNSTGGGSTTINQIDIHNTEMIGASYGVSATAGTSITIAHNRFINPTTQGVYLSGTVGAHVEGNTINTAGTAINLSGATDYANIHDNDLRGATTKVSNTASGTHNVIKDNMGYNPIGTSVVTVGASPYTYTVGASPEVIYVNAGTGVTTSYNGVGVIQGNATVYAHPNSTVSISYSTVPSVITAKM